MASMRRTITSYACRGQRLGYDLGLAALDQRTALRQRSHAVQFQTWRAGKLTLEFWITPFDYAPPQRERAIASQLKEDKLIGLSWRSWITTNRSDGKNVFWNLSHKTTMYGNASDLVAFRLMPLEQSLRKAIDCDCRFSCWTQPRAAWRSMTTQQAKSPSGYGTSVMHHLGSTASHSHL